jgi:hypothetical protein
MADQNLFIEMKYLGMFDYLVKALSLSETQSGYFERVAQRARAIPELREAVVSGKLKLSQARRICGFNYTLFQAPRYHSSRSQI